MAMVGAPSGLVTGPADVDRVGLGGDHLLLALGHELLEQSFDGVFSDLLHAGGGDRDHRRIYPSHEVGPSRADVLVGGVEERLYRDLLCLRRAKAVPVSLLERRPRVLTP